MMDALIQLQFCRFASSYQLLRPVTEIIQILPAGMEHLLELIGLRNSVKLEDIMLFFKKSEENSEFDGRSKDKHQVREESP